MHSVFEGSSGHSGNQVGQGPWRWQPPGWHKVNFWKQGIISYALSPYTVFLHILGYFCMDLALDFPIFFLTRIRGARFHHCNQATCVAVPMMGPARTRVSRLLVVAASLEKPQQPWRNPSHWSEIKTASPWQLWVSCLGALRLRLCVRLVLHLCKLINFQGAHKLHACCHGCQNECFLPHPNTA